MIQVRKKVVKKPIRKIEKKSHFVKFKTSTQRIFGYSKGAKELIKKHPNLMKELSTTFRKKFGAIDSSRMYNTKFRYVTPSGVIIERAFAGNYGGGSNIGTLKVTIKGKSFFVKLTEYSQDSVKKRYDRSIEILKLRNRFNGFKVKVVKPLLYYHSQNFREPNTNTSGRAGIFVTNFIKGNPVHVESYSGTNRHLIYNAIFELNQHLEKNSFFVDSINLNTVFEPKSKTIFLFDLA